MEQIEIRPNSKEDLYWILSDLEGKEELHPATMGHRFVVSAYVNGQREWLNGHYFETLLEATQYLNNVVMDDIEVHQG